MLAVHRPHAPWDRQLGSAVPHAHPLDALDARIVQARMRRSNVPRFGEAYWQADDEIALLRAARDEIARTGFVHPDVEAMLDAAPQAVPVERDREPIAFPVEPAAVQDVPDVPPEPAHSGNEVAVGAA